MKGQPFYVFHTTGEGSCAHNREFLSGTRFRTVHRGQKTLKAPKHIRPLAHALLCEDGTWYELAHENRITTGLGRKSSLHGDTLAFELAFNIEVQGNPWERLTDAQLRTLGAFLTLRTAEGTFHDSLAYTHAMLASEVIPGTNLHMNSRKADGLFATTELGIDLRASGDNLVHPRYMQLFALQREGRLTQEAFNETFGYLGRIEGNFAWRVKRGESAYPLIAGEMRSPAALYFFMNSKTMRTGAELYREAKNSYTTLLHLPEDAIVVFASRNPETRRTAIPAITAHINLFYRRPAFFMAEE